MPCYYNYCFGPFESYNKYSNSIDTLLVSIATPFIVYAIFGLCSIFVKCDFHLKLWFMYILYYLTFDPFFGILTGIIYIFPLFFATYDVTTTKIEEYPVLAIYYFCVIYACLFFVTFFNWCLGYSDFLGNFNTILYAPLFSVKSITLMYYRILIG